MYEYRRSAFDVSRRFNGNNLSLDVGSGGNNNAIVDGYREGRLSVDRIAFVIGFGRNGIFQFDWNARPRWNDKFTRAAVRPLSKRRGRRIFSAASAALSQVERSLGPKQKLKEIVV